jgi:hypothetical protein
LQRQFSLIAKSADSERFFKILRFLEGAKLPLFGRFSGCFVFRGGGGISRNIYRFTIFFVSKEKATVV